MEPPNVTSPNVTSQCESANDGDWPAPRAAGPVHADIAVPGSKSLTNRLLVLGALADGPSRLRRPLRSRDTELMVQCLRALGVGVLDEGADWHLTPAPLHGDTRLDTGLAGTVMRFLPPVAGLSSGAVSFDGDPRMRLRPMQPVLAALRTLGVELDDDGRGALPFTVHGRGAVPGGSVTLDASASSQFVSGLLLAAARYERGVVVQHDGKPVPSQPHIAMTVQVLRERGVLVDDGEANRWAVQPGLIGGFDVEVEPDLSTAAPFLAAALVTGGRVRVADWPQTTTQAGDGLRDILDAMGADVTLDRTGLTVLGTSAVEGIDVDLHDVGELTPVVAAVAALAQSPSWLRGIAHLRGHESDRLAALSTEINALGGDVSETDDGLRIRPRPLHGGLFHTYHDHRMAMAAAVLGLAVDGVVIQDVATTAKTFPQFTDRWAALAGSG